MNQNQVTYLRWLSRAHPDVYRTTITRAQAMHAAGVTLGRYQDEQLGWLNFVIQAVTTAASAVIGKKQADKQVALQKKALELSDAQAAADRVQATKLALLDVNTKRAQAGLPPVDINGIPIAASSLPVPSALAPYVDPKSATLIPGIPNVATYAGGVLALALLAKSIL